jgi:hypothetical protein
MGQSSLLKIILLISIGAIILFPLYAIFIEYPFFETIITGNTSREAVRIATILSSVLICRVQSWPLPRLRGKAVSGIEYITAFVHIACRPRAIISATIKRKRRKREPRTLCVF